jgi:Na+/H+-dicarboxylate symporter
MDAAPQSPSRVATGPATAANLPIWVLGAFLGVLVGLFFGERAAVPQPVGVAYSMMLESVICPSVLSSLIGGLGGLVRARAVRLLRASWAVYLFLWLVALGAIFLLTQD